MKLARIRLFGSRSKTALLSALITLIGVPASQAIDDFEFPPISYSDTKPNDRITQVQRCNKTREVKVNQEREKAFVGGIVKGVKISGFSPGPGISKTRPEATGDHPGKARAN